MEELRAALKEMPLAKQKRFNRGQAVVLVVVALLIVGVYGAFALSFARQKRAPTLASVSAAVDGGLSLQVARQQAETWAARWQSDAQLVGAGTQWQLARAADSPLPGPSWSFSFYSPAAGQVQTLAVDDRGVQAVRQVSVSKALAPVQADWSLESDDLLLTFMAHGGNEFLREHAQVNLHFRLSGQDTGPSIWHLSAIDPVARQAFVVGVDARSRQVVLTS